MPGSHWPEMSQLAGLIPPGVPGALGAWPAQLAPDYSASRYTIIEVNLALALVALIWSIRVRQYRASVLAAASVLCAWSYALVISTIA